MSGSTLKLAELLSELASKSESVGAEAGAALGKGAEFVGEGAKIAEGIGQAAANPNLFTKVVDVAGDIKDVVGVVKNAKTTAKQKLQKILGIVAAGTTVASTATAGIVAAVKEHNESEANEIRLKASEEETRRLKDELAEEKNRTTDKLQDARSETTEAINALKDAAKSSMDEIKREVDSLETQLKQYETRLSDEELQNAKNELKLAAQEQLLNSYKAGRNDSGSHSFHSESNQTNQTFDMMAGMLGLVKDVVTRPRPAATSTQRAQADALDTGGNVDGHDLGEGDKATAGSRKRNSDHADDVAAFKRPRVANDDLHDKTETQPVTRNQRPIPSTRPTEGKARVEVGQPRAPPARNTYDDIFY